MYMSRFLQKIKHAVVEFGIHSSYFSDIYDTLWESFYVIMSFVKNYDLIVESFVREGCSPAERRERTDVII